MCHVQIYFRISGHSQDVCPNAYGAQYKLDVSHNPLVCNASLCWLLAPFAQLKLTVGKYPCAEPLHLRNIPWQDITGDLLGCGE